ncbi:MAG: hypothetical protein NTZ95_04375 [Candidatus Omnitrophica bacterium]|nr:hypothetical protein [Candidatus Omnitrophota bacterium]
MRYRTIIEVVTEAKDKSEAMDIVGEYLSGDVFSGVKMKYSTRAVNGVKKAAITITVLSLMLAAGIISLYMIKPIGSGAPSASAMSAVQPPLQTQLLYIRDAQFKTQWQEEHTKEALRKIKLSR